MRGKFFLSFLAPAFQLSVVSDVAGRKALWEIDLRDLWESPNNPTISVELTTLGAVYFCLPLLTLFGFDRGKCVNVVVALYATECI